MAVIPITQPRPTLDVPTTPAPQYSDASAQVLQGFGAAISDLATTAAALPALDLEANFQRFKFEETQNWNKETFSLNPAESYGFADRYDTGYDDRAGKWETENLARMTPGDRARYQARLVGLKSYLYGRSLTLEREQQLSYINNKVLETLNTTILPRVRDVALLPDDANKVTALAVIEADAIALIDAAPISETAKEALKHDTRKSIHTGFAQSLPPLEQQRLDPTAPPQDFVTRIMQIEGTGKNPLSSAEGPGGFIDSTWIYLIKRYRPELAEGKTDAEILALRTDEHFPLLGEAMVRAYAAENTAYLRANGLSATAGNLYLAHFLGPEGAVAMLNANPAEAAASVSVDPDAPKKNPDVFYYKDHNGVSDPSRPRSVADIVSWAGALMGGTYATDWSRYLDALSYADKMAFAADGSQALIRQQTARQAEMQAAYDIQLNDTLNAVADGTYGLSDWRAAYDNGEGWLTNYADRKRVYDAIQARDKEALNLAAATAMVRDPEYQWNSYSDTDRKALNLYYEKGGPDGGAGLAEGDPAALITLRALMNKTGIMPAASADVLQSGLWSAEGMDSAAAILSGLYREHPHAVDRGLTEESLKRLQDYQALRGAGVPAEELHQRMNPATNPEEAKRRETLRAEGRALAVDIDTKEILRAFDPGVWPPLNEPVAPLDPLLTIALRDDFETLFAERYSVSGNVDVAKAQAFDRMQAKWGVTELGEGQEVWVGGAVGSLFPTRWLVPYPPEQNYPAIGGSHDWMDNDIDETVRAAMPDAQAWHAVPYDETEGSVAFNRSNQSGLPVPYRIWVLDKDGVGDYLRDEDTAAPSRFVFDYPKYKAEYDAKIDRRRESFIGRDQPSETLRGLTEEEFQHLLPPGQSEGDYHQRLNDIRERLATTPWDSPDRQPLLDEYHQLLDEMKGDKSLGPQGRIEAGDNTQLASSLDDNARQIDEAVAELKRLKRQGADRDTQKIDDAVRELQLLRGAMSRRQS